MTFTLDALRDDVLADLQDTANATWSDAQIERACGQALGRFNEVRPQEKSATLTGISGRTVTLSATAPSGLGATDWAAFVRVVAVEYPLSQWPPTYVRFDVAGAVMTMHVDTALVSDTLTVSYETLHTLTAGAGTVPDLHRELLATGAAGYALRQLPAGRSDTLNTGGTKLLDVASSAAETRLQAFEAGLRRLRGVRSGTLYRPEDPLLGRDIVRMPD